MQWNLIGELSYYEKNMGCAKSEGAVDHSSVTRWLKKFCSSYKNLDDDRENFGRPKTVDSKAVFQAIEANPASSTRRISDETGISQSSVVRHLYAHGKSGD